MAADAASVDMMGMPTNPRRRVRRVLAKDEPEMYPLRFERKEDQWDIYLPSRDKPIGEIFRSRPRSDEWIGRMTLDGYRAWTSSKNPQDIVDEFEAWVAAGTPANSPLLRQKTPFKKRRRQSVLELLR
jgi:hypothetical protein